MKPRSPCFHLVAGLVLAIAAAQSWAAPISLIELRGQVGFSCGSGSGGFEQQCSGGENIEMGPFSLLYDPSVSDTDPSPDKGLFEGAIRAFTMTVSQLKRPALVFSLVGSGDFERSVSPSNEDRLFWRMTLAEQNNVVAPSEFVFRLLNQTAGDPNTMPSIDYWSTVAADGVTGAGVAEIDWLQSTSITVDTDPGLLPTPSSLWLLMIGAAGAVLQRGRLRKS